MVDYYVVYPSSAESVVFDGFSVPHPESEIAEYHIVAVYTDRVVLDAYTVAGRGLAEYRQVVADNAERVYKFDVAGHVEDDYPVGFGDRIP